MGQPGISLSITRSWGTFPTLMLCVSFHHSTQRQEGKEKRIFSGPLIFYFLFFFFCASEELGPSGIGTKLKGQENK